jgi:hypothetical protein
MNLHKLILTNNACYKAGRTITPKGIMVHSTGANNPWLKRYVGPDDGLLGKNQYNNHWNQDKPGGRQVCVHAFIGKLANGTSPHIRPFRGIIEVGMAAPVQKARSTILISVLKFVKMG